MKFGGAVIRSAVQDGRACSTKAVRDASKDRFTGRRSNLSNDVNRGFDAHRAGNQFNADLRNSLAHTQRTPRTSAVD